MPWTCVARQTVLISSGPSGHHLFVVLNDACDFATHPAACCVLVGFTSAHGGYYDRTCELAPGCHPFVKHASYVNYAHIRYERQADIEAMVRQGVYLPHHPVDPDLHQRILAGLHQSDRTPGWAKKLGI